MDRALDDDHPMSPSATNGLNNGAENDDDNDDDEFADEKTFSKLPHSSSAQDLAAALKLIREFWTMLDWSSSPPARTHLATLIDVREKSNDIVVSHSNCSIFIFQSISQAVTLYTDLSHKKLLEATKGEKGFFKDGKELAFELEVNALLSTRSKERHHSRKKIKLFSSLGCDRGEQPGASVPIRRRPPRRTQL